MSLVHDFQAELESSFVNFGVQQCTPFEWISILGEEFGEAAKALVDFWQGRSTNLSQYRTELLHVMVVAHNAIDCLDRGIEIDT